MKRLFGCTVSLIYKDEHGEVAINSLIADRTAFWWNERKPDQPSLWDSKIYLGEAFFNEIIRHPVPLDMNTLTALKRSSLGLDLYLWLVYRTFSLRDPLRITCRQVYRQFGVDPTRASDKELPLKVHLRVAIPAPYSLECRRERGDPFGGDPPNRATNSERHFFGGSTVLV